MTTTTPDVRKAGARVEQLLAELGEEADARVSERAEELVSLLVDVYGAGLARIVEIVATSEDSAALADGFAADDLVASLLILHGLHPLGVAERVQRALDGVRPYLGSHAGGVELLGIDDDGVVRLRLEGSCDGCPSSAMTVKLAIERAILEAAPEVIRVDAEGVAEPPAPGPRLIPVESLRQRTNPADAAGEWQEVSSLSTVESGSMRLVTLGGQRVAVCRADGSLVAYRDACPGCGMSLVDGTLAGTWLSCAGCGVRYDVRRAGRGEDGAHLEPLPLLEDSGGAVRIALPVEVAS
jgi:Fe-S cluster biogenesis protein NfuA